MEGERNEEREGRYGRDKRRARARDREER